MKTGKGDRVTVPEGTDTYDYQFVFLREALKPYYEEIEAATEPQAQLAYALYDISKSYIENIV